MSKERMATALETDTYLPALRDALCAVVCEAFKCAGLEGFAKFEFEISVAQNGTATIEANLDVMGILSMQGIKALERNFSLDTVPDASAQMRDET